MEFSDHSLIAPGPDGPIRVRVTSRVLHLLWGEKVGPQDADGLIAAHRTMIDFVLREKIAANDIAHGEVVIDEEDLD